MSNGKFIGTEPKKRKKAYASLILSALFMGAGQIYNRQYIKGAILAITELYILFFMRKPIQHGLWGLFTLGEQPQIRENRRIVVQGDHSIFLMIEGLIVLLLLLLFLFIYILNIRDAYKVGKISEAGGKVNNFKETLKHILEHGYVYLLLTPAIIFTLFTVILPLIFGILMAFTNYSSPNHIPPKNLVDWVGFENFINLFKLKGWSHTFYGVAAWTVIWATIATLATALVGLLYALLINHKMVRFKRFWRTLFILPWAVPSFVSILIFRNIFNGQFGPINKYLEALGIDPVQWMSDPFSTRSALFIVQIWLGFPYWMALMSGVLSNVDRELYEAAEVDGASPFQRFRKITLPLVLYATAPLLIMSFATNFNNFNLIYLFTEGGPVKVDYSFAGSTDILISWIYKLTLNQGQYNMTSTISIILFIVVASFSIWNFRQTKAFKEEDMLR